MKHLKSLKALKSKFGFSLVECIVAIAVFAILSLLVAMLLSAAITGHRNNINETRSLKSQRKEILDDAVVNRADPAFTVEFNFDDKDGNPFSMGYNAQAEIAEATDDRGLELTKFSPLEPAKSYGLPDFKPMELSFWKVVGDGTEVRLSSRNQSVLKKPLLNVCEVTVTHTVHSVGANLCSVEGHDIYSSYEIIKDAPATGKYNSVLEAIIDFGAETAVINAKLDTTTGVTYYLNVFQIIVEGQESPTTSVKDRLRKGVDQDEFIQINILPSTHADNIVAGIIWGDNLVTNPSFNPATDNPLDIPFNKVHTAYFGPHPHKDYKAKADSIILKKAEGESFLKPYAVAIVTKGVPIPDIPYWLNVAPCGHCCNKVCKVTVDNPTGCKDTEKHIVTECKDIDGGCYDRICICCITCKENKMSPCTVSH